MRIRKKGMRVAGPLGIALLAGALVAMAGGLIYGVIIAARDSGPSPLRAGACGFVTDQPGSGHDPWTLLPCTDPAATLVIVRAASVDKCPEGTMTRFLPRGRTATKTKSLCLQMNAAVGDCFTGIDHWLDEEKVGKVACTTPGAFQVNTVSNAVDHRVCAPQRQLHKETDEIVYQNPSKSICLHRVGT
ncbi:hypothetical protein SAMN04244553_6215 [Nocardia amikacinitolerans]|uniref:Uncharacterized protein n=1 Tax=Nocardia amikacinitolerans TaxID=756689 RepID=A0A285LWC2_9NOCA|nr:hypothetical protein [Nocardia amikacinitolerans]SNY89208.1 hypothetical protein SAMN04244553_6215 [Nocardia amikacinitolerans]